ncbi:MAG: hypothetical protein K0R67_2944, partial [Paenibacillus sp.]|nr:hypothetical protein [Paenibacillus sp.]
LNNSRENTIMTGYGSVNVDDQSESASSFYRSRRNNLSEFPALVFTSGALHKKACYYDGSTAVHIPGVSFGLHSNSTIYSSYKMTINTDYMEMTSSTDGAVGVFVDTTLCKRFVVKRDCVATNGGRIHIACYDAAGNILTDLDGTKANAYVKAKVNYGVFWRASYFGGTYSTSTDANADFYFNVTSDVKKVRILFWKGTAALYMRSFSIYALDQYAPAVWSGYAEAAGDMNMGTSAPSSGQWVLGKVVMNANPAIISPGSNPYTVTGWIKVTAGSSNALGTDWVEMRTPVGP